MGGFGELTPERDEDGVEDRPWVIEQVTNRHRYADVRQVPIFTSYALIAERAHLELLVTLASLNTGEENTKQNYIKAEKKRKKSFLEILNFFKILQERKTQNSYFEAEKN